MYVWHTAGVVHSNSLIDMTFIKAEILTHFDRSLISYSMSNGKEKTPFFFIIFCEKPFMMKQI